MASFKVFAVVLLSPDDAVKERATTSYPGAFVYNETFILVKTPASTLSAEVAEKVGLRGDDGTSDASGFVIQQRGAYSGYTRRDLWEWFASIEEAGEVR